MASPQRSTTDISVQLWGSHPDLGSDDLWNSLAMPSLEAARTFCASPTGSADLENTAHFRIVRGESDDGMACVEIVEDVPHAAYHTPQAQRRRARERAREDREWRREIAMQAGMGGGCEAYNDAMGY